MPREEEKLVLGKGAAFVKGRLKRLRHVPAEAVSLACSVSRGKPGTGCDRPSRLVKESAPREGLLRAKSCGPSPPLVAASLQRCTHPNLQ